MSGLYNIIYADPPWMYNKRNNANTRFGLGLYGHYKPMKTEDICVMPVQDLADKDCALLLWCPCPKMGLGLQVMDAWGFRYATFGFTWVKVTKDGKPGKDGTRYRFLPGHYTGSNIEPCLLGIKHGGSMEVVDKSVRQIIEEPIREHSRKPDCTRDRIAQLFGDRPRVELFAREEIPGWDRHGNQVNANVLLEP